MINIIVQQKTQFVGRFETTGSVMDQPAPLRRRNTGWDENIAAVWESVSENPNLSIPRRA